MKGKRYTEEQIIRILRETESGASVAELCRRHGVSEWSFYRWRRKYGGMTVSDAKRLKVVTEENARLRKIVAQQPIDIDLHRDISSKNW